MLVLSAKPLDDLALGVALSEKLEQAHIWAPPCALLIALHDLRLGVGAWNGSNHVHQGAAHDTLWKLLCKKSQPHLWLQWVMVEEDSASQAVIGGFII